MLDTIKFEISFQQAGGISDPARRRDEEIKILKHNLGLRLLSDEDPITVAFPPCSDVLLSQIITKDGRPDDVTNYFDEYFAIMEHVIVPFKENLPNVDLVACTRKWSLIECFKQSDEGYIGITYKHPGYNIYDTSGSCCIQFNPWPTPWCLNPSCVTLAGTRRLPSKDDLPINIPNHPDDLEIYVEVTKKLYGDIDSQVKDGCLKPLQKKIKFKTEPQTSSDPNNFFIGFSGQISRGEREIFARCCDTFEDQNYLSVVDSLLRGHYIQRLFIADLVWLFYFERMGIFKILGAILDDYAIKGKIPISDNGISALVMEAMIRQMKSGHSSTVRDRDCSYRRCLGWTSDVGRKLGCDTRVNSAFNNLFHKFIQSALEYYKDRRLATAIQGQNVPGKPSVATLITIGDTINVLKKAFDPFDYGRNYTNTLNGIVWVIAGMALIRELKETIGIPKEYEQPYEYIPAAYDILVLNKSLSTLESNRYVLNKECAIDARDILLDIQVQKTDKDVNFARSGGELEVWLDSVEDRIEGYRTAYRSLTGIDLGESGMPKVEQQV